jgi:hypothetical protein
VGNSDFELFQSEFKRYQKLFGLTGYTVYFKSEPLEGVFASITLDQGRMAATVRLNSKLPAKDKPFKDVKHTAKHEALHLLVGRLDQNARYRYSSEIEISEAVEELVNRLEGLVDDGEGKLQ